jgi:hypothetical protein
VLVSNHHFAAWLTGLIWISFPLLYYVTFWSSRYRYPMDWTLVLCSAVLVARAGSKSLRQSAEVSPPANDHEVVVDLQPK